MAKSAAPSATQIRKKLDEARTHCLHSGAQLTEARAKVFELLLQHHGSAKAYDLLAAMQAVTPGVAPMTVYRALDFLVEQGLVHKVEATSSFVVCQHASHPHEDPVFMVCQRCGTATEMDDPTMNRALTKALGQSGFHAHGVEIKGECQDCADSPAPVSGRKRGAH